MILEYTKLTDSTVSNEIESIERNMGFKAPYSYVTPKTHYSPFQSIRTWTQMKIRLLFKGNSNEISGTLGFIGNGVLTQKLGFLCLAYGTMKTENFDIG